MWNQRFSPTKSAGPVLLISALAALVLFQAWPASAQQTGQLNGYLYADDLKTPVPGAVLKLKMASFEIGYPIFAPPGTPADRVAILRKAFADTFTDPAYLADAKKAAVEVEPIKGETIAAILKEAYGAPQEIKDRLVEASQPPGKLEKVKTVKVSSAISEVGAKGMIGFTAGGKEAHAKLAKKTKITVAGETADAKALKVGMSCEIEYYGDKGQAKAVACK